MHKQRLLPRLAFSGIKKNTMTYLPYLITCIFSVFAIFCFDTILNNDLMKNLPRAGYAMVLLSIGFSLLWLILIPFLYYTERFLMKRRKKEIGLYSILGMEKKHIGVMLFWEAAFVYLFVVLGGILLGVVFSKLLFLILLNMAGLPVNTEFTFNLRAVRDSFLFFGIVTCLNLIDNLVQVGKSNPTELLQASKRGEKEPRFLWLSGLLGILLLGAGYSIAVKARINSEIFLDFFLAVFLVVIATYLLFTSGSIYLLRMLKKNKRFYYKPAHFITVSGMLYRMKKSAAGLVNICIFATMSIITLLCTTALYLGTPELLDFMYPYDLEVTYDNLKTPVNSEIEFLKREAGEWGIGVSRAVEYEYMPVGLTRLEGGFRPSVEMDDRQERYSVTLMSLDDRQERYSVTFMSLDEFNVLEDTAYRLAADEVLIYCTGLDFGYENITVYNEKFRIAEELKEMSLQQKAEENHFMKEYYIIVKDEAVLRRIAQDCYVNYEQGLRRKMIADLKGTQAEKESFIEHFLALDHSRNEVSSFRNGVASKLNTLSMNGGLLFIGVFFSLIFIICLVLVMYYKQITEGFEDKEAFDIMQKVGMSDREVKSTIRQQILLVFTIPILSAAFHTLAAMNMINALLGVLYLYNTLLVYVCGLGVFVLFTFFYMGSYLVTAGSYLKIVRKMT